MAGELPLPVWNEREVPTTYHIDRHEPGRDYSVLPASDNGENDDYLAWINSYKEPLHDAIRSVHSRTAENFERRGIDLPAITRLVGDITDRPVYPLERLFTAHDLRAEPDYTVAAQDGFFDKAMRFGEGGISYGQFEYIMHFVRFRKTYLNRAPKTDVVDTVAHEVGHAALAPVTYVHLDRSAGGNSVYHWFGYSWRYDDRYYGEVLDEASAARIAATTRRELGMVSPAGDASVAEAYRERRGFASAAVGAVALDLLNRAAGNRDELAIYRPLWAFMVNLQAEAARDELGAIIRRATSNELSLEALEAADFSRKALSLGFLERLEEACRIDISRRPSAYIRRVGLQ